MTPMPVIKICGITSEADALLAVGLGADAIGFIFAPSPRQMTPTAVSDIVKRVPPEVLTVGVFRDESPQRVVEIANTVGLGAVQLHGHESIEDSQWVAARVPSTIKAFSAGESAIARFEEFGCDYLLIDGASPGSGEVFDWRLAEGVVDHGRLFVAGGLTPGNVDQAIAHLHPYGVCVDSGVERVPGEKDPQKLAAFVAVARRAAQAVAAEHPDREDEESDGGPYDWLTDR
jgi:phosphoribosylanthranilate isomerase